MRQAGEVTYADAHKQKKNEGYVIVYLLFPCIWEDCETIFVYLKIRIIEFQSYSDMKNALERLDDTEINGRRIKLVEDRSKGSSGRRRR